MEVQYCGTPLAGNLAGRNTAMKNVEDLINRWKQSLTGDGPGGRIELEELDAFLGASGVVGCSDCTCSSCPACTSHCGC
jgi:hypothetical protein